MKTRLWSWYSQQRRLKRQVVALQNLTANMMGNEPGDGMGFHGGETNYILEFTHTVLLAEYVGQLEQGAALQRAGEALCTLRKLMQDCPRGNFNVGQTQDFVANAKKALRVFVQLGLHTKPKVHELAHMAHLIRTRGAPGNWGAWYEEGLNRWTARISKSAHRAVWHTRVLSEFEQAYGLLSRSSRPRLS